MNLDAKLTPAVTCPEELMKSPIPFATTAAPPSTAWGTILAVFIISPPRS